MKFYCPHKEPEYHQTANCSQASARFFMYPMHLLNSSDIPEDMRHSKMVSLRVCYFAGGIVNLYKQWFRGDLDCSLNDIAMEVSKLLQLEAQELFGD